MRNDVNDRNVNGERPQPKQAYRPPKLTEYGSVAKLTQAGNGTSPSDGGGSANMMMSCL